LKTKDLNDIVDYTHIQSLQNGLIVA